LIFSRLSSPSAELLQAFQVQVERWSMDELFVMPINRGDDHPGLTIVSPFRCRTNGWKSMGNTVTANSES
jgi:hypothetical protein